MRSVLFETVPYTFTGVDATLEGVARRYHTTLHELWLKNGRKGTLEAWAAGVKRGASLLIPVPVEEWDFEWESCDGGKAPLSTLVDVCQERSRDPLRASLESQRPLTPAELLGYAMNADLRARLLAPYVEDRARLQDLEVDGGGALGRLALPRGPVWIPYPRLASMSPIAAAPTVRERILATADAGVPDWLRQLWDKHLYPILRDAESLIENAEYCLSLREKVAPEVQNLHIFDWLLQKMGEHPDVDAAQRSALDALRSAFRPLHQLVIDKMAMNPAGALGEDMQPAIGARLLGRLRSDELAVGVKRIFDGPDYKLSSRMDVPIDGRTPQRIQELVCACLGLAIRALTLAHHGEEIRKDIEAAMNATDGAGGASPTGGGGGVLADVMAHAYAGVSVASNAVGNLPGPQSLALSCFMVWMGGALPPATAAPELARAAYTRVVTAVTRVARLDAGEAVAFEKAMRSGDAGQIGRWKATIEDRFQTSRGWNVAMTLLNGISLLKALSDDGSWRDLAQSGIGVYMGTVRAVLSGLRPGTAFASTLSRATPGGLGVIASVLGVLSGASAVTDGLTDGDVALVASGSFQVGGSALTIGGYFLRMPWLGLVGNALLVVSILLALLSEPSKKDICLSVLGQLTKGRWYDRMAPHVPELGSRYRAFVEIAKDSDAYGPLPDSEQIRHTLRTLGFDQDQIDTLLEPPLQFLGPADPGGICVLDPHEVDGQSREIDGQPHEADGQCQ